MTPATRLVRAGLLCLCALFFSSFDGASAQDIVRIRVCVLENSSLTEVIADYNRVSGDTVVAGQRFSARYPVNASYAASAQWYIANDLIEFGGDDYVKWGLPRVLGVTEVTRAGVYRGVPLFVESQSRDAEVLYVPVRPGCEFQPYSVIPPIEMYYAAEFAYGQGDFARALGTLRRPRLVEYGPALKLLGDAHARGHGVARDSAQARRFYQRAISGGHADAYIGLAALAAADLDEAGALRELRSGVGAGSSAAAYELAARHLDGHGVARDSVEALRLLRIAATNAQDELWAAAVGRRIADMYKAGIGLNRDAVAQLEADRRAAGEGDPIASYLMGRRYELGLSVPRDLNTAISHYSQSGAGTRTHGTEALERLGLQSKPESGGPIPTDELERADCLAVEALPLPRNGAADAALGPDRCGATPNRSAAAYFRVQSSENGHASFHAVRRAGTYRGPHAILYASTGVYIRDYSSSSGTGVAFTPYLPVGDYYLVLYAPNPTDRGSLNVSLTPSSDAECARRLRRYRGEAAQGNGGAMEQLSNIYALGRCVDRDAAQAFAWRRRAAEAGNRTAQWNLALAYELGRGTPVNIPEAIRWYREVAKPEQRPDDASNWRESVPRAEEKIRELTARDR